MLREKTAINLARHGFGRREPAARIRVEEAFIFN
jgi:hypothetical protein